MEKIFTDEQFWALCDAHTSLPIPLSEADLTKPFIYCRNFGIMYCAPCYHQVGMATLYAFYHGLNNGIEAMEKFDFSSLGEVADAWVNIPGTAFRSSVGKKVIAGCGANLTAIEKRFFRDINYVCENYYG